ncbi:MAG: GNAT family N-acetyltransferase [Saprospiraceae bacterium]
MQHTIRSLELADIECIPSFQPKDWGDVATRFREHFGQSYFKPIKALKDNELVGIGQLILFEASAWLGNIIVKESHWHQGIGKSITLHLMEMAKDYNKSDLYLLATTQGQPLYTKLGFQTCGTHHFYKQEQPIVNSSRPHPAIRRAEPQDFAAMLQLDEQASGEKRGALLQRYLTGGWVFLAENQASIEGFYLPGLGEGLIVATNASAGIALLECRNQPNVVIPSDNIMVSKYLQTQSYQCFRTASLMYKGKNKTWQPQLIYSRIGGYAG